MFYVVAKNQDGKHIVLSSAETNRITAQNDISGQAQIRGLFVNLDEVRLAKGTGKQGRTMTKFYKERGKTGHNGRGYERAL
ncbi:hypothetical protein GCM10023310_69040 [Paenibacillus vulneris]|uniref:50S ribosomal protein L4 n=1 Tax=Paenibacillus vulneris TaxID=1133364 RepID=A0ABW3UIQ1_9BACL